MMSAQEANTAKRAKNVADEKVALITGITGQVRTLLHFFSCAHRSDVGCRNLFPAAVAGIVYCLAFVIKPEIH